MSYQTKKPFHFFKKIPLERERHIFFNCILVSLTLSVFFFFFFFFVVIYRQANISYFVLFYFFIIFFRITGSVHLVLAQGPSYNACSYNSIEPTATYCALSEPLLFEYITIIQYT